MPSLRPPSSCLSRCRGWGWPRSAAAGWLEPLAGKPLNFRVKGHPAAVFMPMWQMGVADHFTTYPVFTGPK